MTRRLTFAIAAAAIGGAMFISADAQATTCGRTGYSSYSSHYRHHSGYYHRPRVVVVHRPHYVHHRPRYTHHYHHHRRHYTPRYHRPYYRRPTYCR